MDRFPSLDEGRTDSLGSDTKRSSVTALKDHSHSTETIFAFPSLGNKALNIKVLTILDISQELYNN